LQVEKGFRNGTFGSVGFQPQMGYKRQLADSLRKLGLTKTGDRVDDLYDMMDNWLTRTTALGAGEYETPANYMKMFESKIDSSIELFSRA